MFHPTFYPLLVVTVEGDGDDEALLHAASPPTPSARWGFHYRLLHGEDWAEEPGEAPTASIVLVLDPLDADVVWGAAERLHAWEPLGEGGRDGVGVHVRLKRGAEIVEVESWQPGPDALERPLMEHLLRPVAGSGDTPVASLAREIRRSLCLP